MKILITPAQVAQIAFHAPDFITPDAVSEATILAAQQKYILLAVGADLYRALCEGLHPALLADYLAQPLALWVKSLMLPSLAVQSGAGGVMEPHGRHLTSARDTRLASAVRRLRGDAEALMRRAVGHIEEHSDDYPEWNSRLGSTGGCSIAGGVVLEKSRRR